MKAINILEIFLKSDSTLSLKEISKLTGLNVATTYRLVSTLLQRGYLSHNQNKGMYSLGFVTGESMRSLNEATGEDMVHVFIPSSPTPVTGYVVFLPRRDVIDLPLTVDEALRFSISGGVLVPPKEVVEAALEAQEQPELPAPTDPAWAADE